MRFEKLDSRIRELPVSQIKEIIIESMKKDTEEHLLVSRRALFVLEEKMPDDEFIEFCESIL